MSRNMLIQLTAMKVIAATNQIDILDPALLQSGHLDQKIEFPLPNDTARLRILQIHSRKMAVSSDVNYKELARSTDEFNGMQLKAVCVEVGMIALREGATKLTHLHFLSSISEGLSVILTWSTNADCDVLCVDPYFVIPFGYYTNHIKSWILQPFNLVVCVDPLSHILRNLLYHLGIIHKLYY